MKRFLLLLALLPSLAFSQQWNEKIVFKIYTDSSVYYSYHIAKFDARVEIDSAWLNNILNLTEMKVKDSTSLTNRTIAIGDIEKLTISRNSPIIISSAQSLGINTKIDRKIKKDYISRIEDKYMENLLNGSMDLQYSKYLRLKKIAILLDIAGISIAGFPLLANFFITGYLFPTNAIFLFVLVGGTFISAGLTINNLLNEDFKAFFQN